MTLNELSYDILETLEKHKITKDYRVSIRHIEYLIREYRSQGIKEFFKQEQEVNPSWVQRIGKLSPTKVTPADDPNITGCKCIIGRITIPQVVDITDDLGVYRVSSACGTKKFYPITKDRYMELVQGSLRSKFDYYFRIGTYLYVAPYLKEINADLILENPLDAYVINSENIPTGSLVVGTSYTVVSGRITHNSVIYESGAMFTAAATTFTGSGLVKYTNQKIAMTTRDVYPMSHSMTEYIKMKIFTQDFGVEMKMVADIDNDSQDETAKNQKA